jgi:ribose-phosphate pyrophosphokinase
MFVDDIADGGYTFIELAKKLKERGVDKVYLVVSHGIFAKGFDNLKENIDHVYTSDSFAVFSTDFVTTVPLSSILSFDEYYCMGKTRTTFDRRFVD